MIALTEHPVVRAMEAYYAACYERGQAARETGALIPSIPDKPEQFYLGVRLRHLLQMDPNAVYHMVGDSTVAYYVSGKATNTPAGGCCRIVLAPDGKHRRIGPVGHDPRKVMSNV
jgi:hypothetical protein